MGCSFMSSCFTNSEVTSNPNPKKFTLIEDWISDKYHLMRVRYHGCTNYEGEKLLLYETKNFECVIADKEKGLDPHFCETGVSPIARFKPDSRGLQLALSIVNRGGHDA